MLIYLYIYITSSALSIFSILVKNKILALAIIYLLFVMILVFVGLRHGIGSDWESYNAYFHFPWKEKSDTFNVMFNSLSHLFYYIGVKFNYLVFFITLIALLPILTVSRNYKYGVIVFFLYSTVYLISLMGLMRQMIAVSLCLLAAERLFQGKNRQYFIYVLIAISFHTSALVFFLAYLVQKIRLNMWAIFFIVIAIIIFSNLIIEQVGYYLIHNDIMANKVKAYFYLPDYNQTPPYYSSSSLNTILMFAQKTLFLIIFLYYFTKISYNDKGIFYIKIYLLSLILNLTFYFSIPIIATRGSIYFSIVEIVLLALLCEYTKYKWLFIFVILLYGGIKYFKIIYSFHTQMIPYQTIFSFH